MVERLSAANGSGLEDIRGEAYSLLSTLLRLQGSPIEGIQAAYQAVRLADAQPARWQRLLDLGTALAELGYSTPARLAFQAVVAPGSGVLGDRAHVALMQLATADGDRLAFERHRSAVSEVGRWPAEMAVNYRLHLGLGLARFRQFSRARATWADALALAREHGLTEWCRRLEERAEPDPLEVEAVAWLSRRRRKRPSET
jgi:hypothetical protein